MTTLNTVNEGQLNTYPTLDEELIRLLIDVDSELSAIAYGRPPSDKEKLLRMSGLARKRYSEIVERTGKLRWC